MGVKRIVYGILFVFLVGGIWIVSGLLQRPAEESYPIVFFGDSMIGQVRTEDGIAGLLAEKLHTPILNAAFGGTNMGRADEGKSVAKNYDCLSMVALSEAVRYQDFGPQQTVTVTLNGTDYFEELIDTLAKVDFEAVSIVFIEQGTNDYNSGIPLYDLSGKEDPYTFEGALRRTIATLREGLPQARIILVTPTFCWFPAYGEDVDCTNWKPCGYTLQEYVELEKKVAKELSIECIDNYGVFEHVEKEYCYQYTIDGLHANEYGRELIAHAIFEYLREHP